MNELNRKMRLTRKARIKWLLSELKMMKICIKYFHYFGKPDDEEQKEELRNNLRLYDESVNRIESEFLSKIRAELNNKKHICGREYVEMYGECPICENCPHGCPLENKTDC